MRVLVTGATGFVGRALIPMLMQAGHEVVAAARRPAVVSGLAVRVVGEVGPDTDWSEALEGCDAVVHLAARVHVMQADAGADIAAFRSVNVAGTARLARQAALAGVSRLVFVSTVKVHGECSPGHALTERDAPHPKEPYAVSKAEAEEALREVMAQTSLEVVILRPPLVYGPGVGANFAALLHAVKSGWPLPFGAIRNRRSLVYVGNLCDAILRCVLHPAAVGRTFLVDDGVPVSTPELIRALAAACGRRPRLIAIPPAWLQVAGTVFGRRQAVDRLLGDLEVDSGLFREVCGWAPPFDLGAALRASFRA
jgi:nucleoside-diphosphate-sugar epimerase